MALLNTYLNAGPACLAAAQNCFAHGLPTTPDFVANTPVTPSQTSIPISNVTRGAAHVAMIANIQQNSESLFAVFASPIR